MATNSEADSELQEGLLLDDILLVRELCVASDRHNTSTEEVIWPFAKPIPNLGNLGLV